MKNNIGKIIVLLNIFILLCLVLLPIFNTKLKAQTRSRYMDKGDEYLEKADKTHAYGDTEVKISYAIQALAAYTAALSEK